MSKTVLFQTIQFTLQKQFHFKQYSLAYVRSLHTKTVLFQAIQSSMNTHFSSIWAIYSTLSSYMTLSQVGSALLEPHNQFVSSHIQNTC